MTNLGAGAALVTGGHCDGPPDDLLALRSYLAEGRHLVETFLYIATHPDPDRQEADRVTIYAGVENGKTLGTPIALMVANRDQRPGDYQDMQNIPRPSHADYTYQMKYGIRASSGGGRSSARETIGRVAAGAIAEKVLLACQELLVPGAIRSLADRPVNHPIHIVHQEKIINLFYLLEEVIKLYCSSLHLPQVEYRGD